MIAAGQHASLLHLCYLYERDQVLLSFYISSGIPNAFLLPEGMPHDYS